MALYKPHERKGNKRNGIRGDVERKYFIQDLNRDGKSDFISFTSKYSYHLYDNRKKHQKEESSFLIQYYENLGENEQDDFVFEDKKILNVDIYSISNMSAYHQFVVASFDQYYEHRHNFYPFIKDVERFYDSFFKEWKVKFKKLNIPSIAKNNKAGHYYPLLGNFKINNSNENILIFHEDRVIKYNHPEFTKSSRIRSVNQGGLKTEIEYKELDPTKNPNFYSSIKKEKFPYMEIDKLSNSFVVAQLRQEVSHNQIRKQDFRYRGFTTHLQGKGMIGFRQTARSYWYTDDLVSTKI